MNPAVGLLISDGVVVLLSLLVFNTTSFMLAILSCVVTYVTMQIIEMLTDKSRNNRQIAEN
jgi:hypothetical protein